MDSQSNQSLNQPIQSTVNMLDDPSPKRRRIDNEQSVNRIQPTNNCFTIRKERINELDNHSDNHMNNQSNHHFNHEQSDQLNSQLSNHEHNQSIIQSSNHSITQPPFQTLIPPILAQICSHLQLDEKCYRLTHLNHTISRSITDPINRSHYFRNAIWLGVRTPNWPATILPDAVSQYFASLSFGRLPYVQYASRLSVFIDAESDIDADWHLDFIDQTIKALSTNVLKSLAILEIGDNWSDLHTNTIIDNIPVNQRSLTELSIEVRVDPLNPSVPPAFPHLKWSKLKQLSSLRHVHLGFPSCCVFTESDANALRSLLASLPDSVEELSFKGGSSEVLALEAMFYDTALLPMLKRFCFLHLDIVQPLDLACAVMSTIMKSTGKPRPLISGLRLMQIEPIQHMQLVDLFCEDVLDEATCAYLQSCRLWPSLVRLDIELPDEPVRLVERTLAALLEFGSQRSISDLKVSNEHEPLRLNALNVRCMARMSSLRCLNLRSAGRGLFASCDLLSLLPAGCWPHLHRLDIETTVENEQTLATLLSAAPNLLELVLTEDVVHTPIDADPNLTLRPTQVLAMVLFYCPSIVRVYLKISDASESLDSVRQAFTQYPLGPRSAQHLRALLLDDVEDFTRAGMHCLLAYLSQAPNLTYLHAPITADTPLLEICLFRSLPHLRVLEQVRLVLEDSEGTIMNLYDELGAFIHYMPIYEPIPRLETMRGDRIFDSPPLEFDRAHKVTAWSDGHCGFYRAFRQGKDGSCSLSRQRFFDVLHSRLSDDEKARLAAWDTGDYSRE